MRLVFDVQIDQKYKKVKVIVGSSHRKLEIQYGTIGYASEEISSFVKSVVEQEAKGEK